MIFSPNQDASFATKFAMIKRHNRIRVDIRMRITNRNRHILKWLLLLAHEMLDSQINGVRLFIDDPSDLEKCNVILKNLRNQTKLNVGESTFDKIALSGITDTNIRQGDGLYIIYNPNNIYSPNNPNVLEEVQALCFHAALKKIPVLLINPILMVHHFFTLN